MKATGSAARWNGPSGNAWVQSQSVMDELYRPLEDLLVDAVGARQPDRVLDVGCGTGGTTVAVARRFEPRECVGVDISAPMLGAARARAERDGVEVTFVQADAQEHEWEPARFGTVMSRFGVMFFDDPVRAFGNLHRAADGAADLIFLVWRGLDENPFMTTAERAAAPLLPNLPPRDPDAPGQFAFADAVKVRRILDTAGWTGIAVEPVDVECAMPERELAGYFTRLGPVGLALTEADEDTRARVVDLVRPAFDRFVHGDRVRFTAACWLVTARAA